MSDTPRFTYPCWPSIARKASPILRFLAAHSHAIVQHPHRIPERMYFSASTVILGKMNGYLSYEISLAELVSWARKTLAAGDLSLDDESLSRDLVARAGKPDRNGLGLTMEDYSDLLGRLGQESRVSIGPLRR